MQFLHYCHTQLLSNVSVFVYFEDCISSVSLFKRNSLIHLMTLFKDSGTIHVIVCVEAEESQMGAESAKLLKLQHSYYNNYKINKLITHLNVHKLTHLVSITCL